MNRSLIFLALFASASAMADSGVASMNNANIQDSGVQYKGNFNVNQAAGDQLQQTNTRAIAIGTNAGASTHINQKIDTPRQPFDERYIHDRWHLFQ